MSNDGKFYVVGPNFKVGDPVRIVGARGVGEIIGSKFRALVIEYTEYTVVIRNKVHTVTPDELRSDQ